MRKSVFLSACKLFVLSVMLVGISACAMEQAETNRNARGPSLVVDHLQNSLMF